MPSKKKKGIGKKKKPPIQSVGEASFWTNTEECAYYANLGE